MSDRFQNYIQGRTANPKLPLDDVPEESKTFDQELVELLNKHSMENFSGTPDWILMEYLRKCLEAWDLGVRLRAEWRGESVELPALQQLHDGKRTVPMVVYSGNLRMRNDIGEAEIKLAPGEQVPIGKIERVIAVFEADPDDSGC